MNQEKYIHKLECLTNSELLSEENKLYSHLRRINQSMGFQRRYGKNNPFSQMQVNRENILEKINLLKRFKDGTYYLPAPLPKINDCHEKTWNGLVRYGGTDV